jgi:ubiquinone biosynthesis protein Coq4
MPTPRTLNFSAPPNVLTRTVAILRASYRVLFLRWPDYSFDDLATIQDGLDGPAFQNAARKMRDDPDGRCLMEARTELSLRTVDWSHLSQLPIDTLGYSTWHHFYANGLFEEIVIGPPIVQWDPDTEYAKRRYRATHDSRHVLTGLGVEGFEEIILQSFQCAQLPQKLSAFIVLLGGLKHALIDGRWRELLSGIPRAWRVGRQARFLSNVPFESLWEVPLETVRQQYGIRTLGSAYPVRERHPDAPWAPSWE